MNLQAKTKLQSEPPPTLQNSRKESKVEIENDSTKSHGSSRFKATSKCYHSILSTLKHIHIPFSKICTASEAECLARVTRMETASVKDVDVYREGTPPSNDRERRGRAGDV